MYAVFETGGKQYKVQEGDVIFVEKLDAEADSSVTFDKVLALCDKSLTIGKPFVKDATVTAKVLKSGKGEKIRIFKYKSKKGYRRRMGHRQPYTKIQVESIVKAAKA